MHRGHALTVAVDEADVRGPQQFQVERTAAEQHLVQGLLHVAPVQFPVAATFQVKLHRAAHQFLDEGRAHEPGTLHDEGDHIVGNSDALRVQPCQLGPAFFVGQRELDRLVHSARPRSQGLLQRLGPVGGEDEQDVGPFAQAVHLVQ